VSKGRKFKKKKKKPDKTTTSWGVSKEILYPNNTTTFREVSKGKKFFKKTRQNYYLMGGE
jgi:hypothetical protein